MGRCRCRRRYIVGLEPQPQAKLSKGEYTEFSNLAKKIEKYIAKDISELGKCNIIKHIIHPIDEQPVFVPAYRKSQSERQEIKLQIDEMLQAGIIWRFILMMSLYIVRSLKII
jgi:hypothetical protein